MADTKYYIYMYLDLDNVPFYIGKGCFSRYSVGSHLHPKQGRNEHLRRKIRKIGKDNVRVHFLNKDLSEEDAFRWEQYWIKYIGRRDKKEGSLCNMTDGGDGRSKGKNYGSPEYRKEYAALNKDRIRAVQRQWKEKNPQKKAAICASYYRRHRERILQYNKQHNKVYYNRVRST